MIIDGLGWKEQGPYCQLCGAHMGEYYRRNGTPEDKNKWFINPHGYKSYDYNTCPECGQKYEYVEDDRMILSEEQLQALRDLF